MNFEGLSLPKIESKSYMQPVIRVFKLLKRWCALARLHTASMWSLM